MKNPRPYRGRLAPSPTGYLHLGHAKTFSTAYQRCKDANGFLIYRDEDIDPVRCKREYAEAAVEDLLRLGLRWQEGPIRQSERIHLYLEVLEWLINQGRVYPSTHSRKEIAETSSEQTTPTGETLFPRTLRTESRKPDFPADKWTNWRFRVPDERLVEFVDTNQGPQSFKAGKDFGDFLVWRKEGVPAYELAVVVDDAAMKISEVVRGADLLLSTARQLLLYEALNLEPPGFFHENLVRDESGERLAKRSDSLALRTLFEKGHSPDAIKAMWEDRSR